MRLYIYMCGIASKSLKEKLPSFEEIGNFCFKYSYPEIKPRMLAFKAHSAMVELIRWGYIEYLPEVEGRENQYKITTKEQWKPFARRDRHILLPSLD